jgi:ribosomal protein S18 acetylase RimI-like enzyme
MTAEGHDVLDRGLRAADTQRTAATGLRPGEERSVLSALASWEPPNGCGWQLHPGDLGWFSRFESTEVERAVLIWRSAGRVVAILLLDGPVLGRCAIAPGALFDHALANEIIDEATNRLECTDEGLWLEPPPGPSALAAVLAERGWLRSEETWLHLWRRFTDADFSPPEPPAGAVVRPLRPDDLERRVALQRAAFTGSTLTVPRYLRMRARPGHDERFDLVCETSGELVAFCVAWLGAPGGAALLEPVGAHPEHRGRGYAAATVRTAFAALAAAGASGVAVFTPSDNLAAAALYRAVGMVTVELRHDFHRPAG